MGEGSELAPWDQEEEKKVDAIQVMDTSAIAALNRSEIESQLTAAHRFGRNITRFMKQSIGLATITRETAESCLYAVPRGGKTISGPSVRLAEIMASTYGNLHVGARVVDEDEKFVTAQGVAWDLETNLRVSVEVRRRITDKNGRKFNDDMVGVTSAAACSIALRNAIFRVVPRAFVDQVYEKCRTVAVGDAKTLTARRDEVLSRLGKMGATQERVLNSMGLRGVDDITLEALEQLIGMGTAIKNGDRNIDELFPAVVAAVPGADQPGRKMSLKKPPVVTVKGVDGKPVKGVEPISGAEMRVTHEASCAWHSSDGKTCDCGVIARLQDAEITVEPEPGSDG